MLDFSNLNKASLKVKMPDGSELAVYSPTKHIFDNLNALEERFNNGTQMNDMDAISEIYRLMAEIFSRNSQGKKITAKALEEQLDFEDLQMFFNAYVAFVAGEANDPN